MSRNQRFRNKNLSEFWQREAALGRKPALPVRIPVGWVDWSWMWNGSKEYDLKPLPFAYRWHFLCVIAEANRSNSVDGMIKRSVAEWALDPRINDSDRGAIIDVLLDHGLLAEADDTGSVLSILEYEQYLPSRKELRPEIHPSVRDAVLDRDGHRCLRCSTTDDLTMDHIDAFSHGGRETVENLQTLCRSCNSWKGARRIDFRKIAS